MNITSPKPRGFANCQASPVSLSSSAARASFGHWVDRGENKTSNVVYAISDREMTEEEWFARYAKPADAIPGPTEH